MKAQVTTYVILGIVLLTVATMGLIFGDRIMHRISEIEVFRQAEIPVKLQPIDNRVRECAKEISKEAVIVLGDQGGYINLPEDNLFPTIKHPFANSLAVFPGAEWNIAYWFYETANGIQNSNIPTLESMELEIANYLEDNIDECLNFQDFNYNIKQGRRNVGVEIKEEVVDVNLQMPLQIELEDEILRLDRFNEQIDVGLGRVYDMAKTIMEAENKDFFLEERTIDAMVVFDEIPYSGTEFSCDTKLWTKQDVEASLRNILADNIPLIKVKDTDFAYSEDLRYYEWNVGDAYKDLSIEVKYNPAWPLAMEVEPSEGDILKGNNFFDTSNEGLQFITAFFCLTDYHFIYDVKYPAMIRVKDDVSFNNEGYEFSFAAMVIVDNNQPRANKLGTLNIPETESEICKYKVSRNSVNVETPEGIAVEGADVSYKCVNAICDIGRTNADGELEAMFPLCVNGFIIAEKEGMHKGRVEYSTNLEGSASVNVYPYREKNLNFMLIDGNSLRNPSETEEVVFILNNNDLSHSTTVTNENNNIRLIPGVYSVTSYVMEDSPFDIKIEGKDIEKCVDVPVKGFFGIFGGTEEKCTNVKTPDINLKKVIKGGANFEFEVTDEQLRSYNTLTLFTVVERVPRSMDELNQIYDNLQTNALKPGFRFPNLG